MSRESQVRDESRAASLLRIAATLRAGANIGDSSFDAHLPRRYQWASDTHWTPVAACREAAEWLAPEPGSRVLDVGSGVGKLCLVGALATQGTFVGIEQRPHLVQIARALGRQLGATSAAFLCDDAFAVDWRDFSSVYFFNPFAEGLFPDALRIDTTVEQSEQGYELAIAQLTDKLSNLRRGTRVVIYHALGCMLPEGFQRIDHKRSGHSSMELWVRE